MTKDEKDRIEELEEGRFENLVKQVEEIHKQIVGNGKEGLLTRVTKNTVKLNALIFGVSVIYIAVIGAVVKFFMG